MQSAKHTLNPTLWQHYLKSETWKLAATTTCCCCCCCCAAACVCTSLAIRADLSAKTTNKFGTHIGSLPRRWHSVKQVPYEPEPVQGIRKASAKAYSNIVSPMIVTNHSMGDEPTSTVIPSSSRAFRSFCSSFFILRSATLAVMAAHGYVASPALDVACYFGELVCLRQTWPRSLISYYLF